MATKAQLVYEAAEELIAEGVDKADAFKRLADVLVGRMTRSVVRITPTRRSSRAVATAPGLAGGRPHQRTR